MTAGIDRLKASSHPTQRQGIYLGIVKQVTPDNKAYVFIPKLANTIGPMRAVSGFSLTNDIMVLCAHVGGGTEEMYILGTTTAIESPTFNGNVTVNGDLTVTGKLTFAYKVGDTGPGGGIIFFVDRFDEHSGFTYLEVAPVGTQVQRSWATDVNSNQTTAVSGADSKALGGGYQNTLDIVAQTGNVAATCAAAYCADLTSGGQSDWYLPSLAEIKMVWSVVHLDLNVGGFASDSYWSSSETDAPTAWTQYFHSGNEANDDKTNAYYVRPVRRF